MIAVLNTARKIEDENIVYIEFLIDNYTKGIEEEKPMIDNNNKDILEWMSEIIVYRKKCVIFMESMTDDKSDMIYVVEILPSKLRLRNIKGICITIRDIFDYMALHIEGQFNKNSLLQSYILAFLLAGYVQFLVCFWCVLLKNLVLLIINIHSQPAKLQKKQCGGVHFWLIVLHIECRFNKNVTPRECFCQLEINY